MERRCGIGMLGWRQGMPRWADDPMRRRDGSCWRIDQEADFSLKGCLTAVGADRGDGNNSSVTISDST